MRKLPEDFRINILLPGAVWLLVSTLIGRVAVARMETDTITVILFVVITLVVFAIPMAVYMEYRRKIEECVSRHKPGHTWRVVDCRRVEEETDASLQPAALPQDFPDALKGGKPSLYWMPCAGRGFWTRNTAHARVATPRRWLS